jgi:hypothetical protein
VVCVFDRGHELVLLRNAGFEFNLDGAFLYNLDPYQPRAQVGGTPTLRRPQQPSVQVLAIAQSDIAGKRSFSTF